MKNTKTNHSFLSLLLLSVATVLVVSFLLSWFRPQNSGSASQSPTPGNSTPVYTPPGNLLPGYSTASFSTPYPPPPPVNTPLTMNRYYSDLKATGEAYWLTHPTPNQQALTAPFPTVPIGPWPTGIYKGDKQSDVSLVANIINQWFGVVNGENMRVMAGALIDNPQLGVIYVYTTANNKISTNERIDAPSPSGALRIMSEQEGRLKIVSEKGSIYFFDTPSHQFISSIDAISPPTVTLLPTITPFLWPTPYPGPISTPISR